MGISIRLEVKESRRDTGLIGETLHVTYKASCSKLRKWYIGSYRGAPITTVGGGLEVKHDMGNKGEGDSIRTLTSTIFSKKLLKSQFNYTCQVSKVYTKWSTLFLLRPLLPAFFIFWNQIEKSLLLIICPFSASQALSWYSLTLFLTHFFTSNAYLWSWEITSGEQGGLIVVVLSPFWKEACNKPTMCLFLGLPCPLLVNGEEAPPPLADITTLWGRSHPTYVGIHYHALLPTQKCIQ